jgi:uncharacterized protein
MIFHCLLTWLLRSYLAFGLFYAGFGFLVTPSFGLAQAYGGADSVEYNNALGFFVLSKSSFVHRHK